MVMTYTYKQLCVLFQRSPVSNTMRKRLVALQQAGFPPPLPGGGGRWSKPAVDAWLANWGSTLSSPAFRAGEGGAHAPDEGPGAPAPTITHLQQELNRIYN